MVGSLWLVGHHRRTPAEDTFPSRRFDEWTAGEGRVGEAGGEPEKVVDHDEGVVCGGWGISDGKETK
jgi:hypothetical protein